MRIAKHIGIVAVSAEGAALCYRTICLEGAKVLGPHSHPEVTMHTIPLAEYMRYVEGARWEEAGRLLLSSAKKLAAVGADLLVCPDNTLHQALDLIRGDSPAAWLHIAQRKSPRSLQSEVLGGWVSSALVTSWKAPSIKRSYR